VQLSTQLFALKVVPGALKAAVGDVAGDIATQITCATPPLERVVVLSPLTDPVLNKTFELVCGQRADVLGVVQQLCSSQPDPYCVSVLGLLMIVILSVVGEMRGFLAVQGELAQRAATVVS
jgi:hypothetical protein